MDSEWRTIWNSTCSWENIPHLRCLPFQVFYSVILQTIPVPPGACCCTPDALNAWRIIIWQVCVDLFLWRQKQESNRCSITSEETPKHFVMDSVLQCTQNVLCFSTEGYEKPWSLNSMSGMSGDASGVSSVSALPCSPPCLMQHSHSPIPSIM